MRKIITGAFGVVLVGVCFGIGMFATFAAEPESPGIEGKTIFERACAMCHRFDIRIVGPPMDEVLPKYENNRAKLIGYIKDPVKVNPDYPPMPKSDLGDEDVQAVAEYLLKHLESASRPPEDDLSYQEAILGAVLRKASGKLVLSLGRFELGDRDTVTVRSRETGEEFKVGLSSVYEDTSYSAVLDDSVYEMIVPRNYECYVVWEIPGDIEKMEKLLFDIHTYQNRLRKSLGAEIISPGQLVSSRIVIGKLQKFHRIAARIVRKFFEIGRKLDKYDLFRYPVEFEIGFSPDVAKAFGGNTEAYRKATQDLIFEEFGRTLWFEFGFGEDLIAIIFNAPLTMKNFFAEGTSDDYRFFVPSPYIKVPPAVLNAAWYIHRQDIAPEISRKIKLRLFKDSMIHDRELLRHALLHGWAIGTADRSLILSYSNPYVEAGDTVYVRFGDGETVPLRILEAGRNRTYSVSEKLKEELFSRIDSPVPVSMFSE